MHAAASFDVRPAETVVVEDSKPGMLAGLRAGMRVLGLGHEEQSDSELEGVNFMADAWMLHRHLVTLDMAG